MPEFLQIFLTGLAGAVIFALFDYFGFNISLKRKWADYTHRNKYRTAQLLFHILLTLLLFVFTGWQTALIMNIIWWTWGCDFVFYLFCEIFNIGNDRGNFRKEVLSNSVQWAWWTPYGLLFTGKGKTIKFIILLTQFIFGILISIFISII
jgi:hypothetical protein